MIRDPLFSAIAKLSVASHTLRKVLVIFRSWGGNGDWIRPLTWAKGALAAYMHMKWHA
jgi:hypothetical protein